MSMVHSHTCKQNTHAHKIKYIKFSRLQFTGLFIVLLFSRQGLSVYTRLTCWKRVPDPLGDRVISGLKLSCRCPESNLHPLQEHRVLLTTEPSPQPPCESLYVGEKHHQSFKLSHTENTGAVPLQCDFFEGNWNEEWFPHTAYAQRASHDWVSGMPA